jgi:hypothetical protein
VNRSGDRARGRQRAPQRVDDGLAARARVSRAPAVHDEREPFGVHAADDADEAGPGHRRKWNLPGFSHEEDGFPPIEDVIDFEVERARQQRMAGLGGLARERERSAADEW